MSNDTLEASRLSPQQRRHWLTYETGLSDRVQCVIRISPCVCGDTVERILNELVSRHEILRTRFPRLDGMRLPVQSVTQAVPVLRRKEIAEIDAAADASVVADVAALERCLPLDLENGSPLHVLLIESPHGDNALILTLSALCADSWSLRNLVSEMNALHEGTVPDSDSIVQYFQFSEW